MDLVAIFVSARRDRTLLGAREIRADFFRDEDRLLSLAFHVNFTRARGYGGFPMYWL